MLAMRAAVPTRRPAVGAAPAAAPVAAPTHKDMTEMNEVLVAAKPTGKGPEKRLPAICRSVSIRKAGPIAQLFGMLPVSWLSLMLLQPREAVGRRNKGGDWRGRPPPAEWWRVQGEQSVPARFGAMQNEEAGHA